MIEYEYVALKVGSKRRSKTFLYIIISCIRNCKVVRCSKEKAEYMVGYQRELDPSRFEKITEFLNQDGNNIMPGSVLIAIKENYINIIPIDEEK